MHASIDKKLLNESASTLESIMDNIFYSVRRSASNCQISIIIGSIYHVLLVDVMGQSKS